MTFLAPLFLFVGLAAAIPLLIHLIRRRVGVRFDFPAVRYLQRAEQENRRTLRLRNLLLMILRVAMVLLLAMAAAKPFGRMIGTGHAPAAMAIVIDNSLSSSVVVGGRSLLDRFKSEAGSLLASSLPTDRAWLITADGKVIGGVSASIAQAVAALEPTTAVTNLSDALRRASALAHGAAQSTKQVVVLTDAQRSSWSEPVTADVPVAVWSPTLALPENHSVALAEARPVRWTPRGEVAMSIDARDSLTFRVTIDGRTFARGTAAPREETVVRASPAERGWVAGSVDLAPDEMAADDIRYFAAWIGAAPAVHATAGAGEFVSAAVDVLKASGRVIAGTAIALGPADEIQTLPALIVAPVDPVHLGAANRALQRLAVPWRFAQRRQQPIDAVGASLGSVSVSDRYDLVPQAGADADTLASAAQAPWIVAGPGYVLVGSPLTASATALPIRATFIPWLAATITERLSGDRGAVVAASPGAVIKRPPGVDQIEMSDKTRIAVADSISAPPNPGVYFFLSEGRRVGAIVVNPPVSESNLDRLTTAELEDRFGKGAVVDASAPNQLQRVIYRAASTRSLLPPILVSVLVILFVEGLVVTARRREVA